MIRHELNLVPSNRNIEKLNTKIEFRVIQAISLFEDGQEEQFQTIFTSLMQVKPTLITDALKKQDPLVRNYWTALSFALCNKDNTKDIITKWQVLKDQRIFKRPFLQLGKCYQKLGKDEKACECYQKCIKLAGDCEDAYFLKGRLLLRLDKEEEGINFIKIGNSINNDGWQMFQILGEHYERKGYYKQAIELFIKFQEIKSSQKVQERIEVLKGRLLKEEQDKRLKKMKEQEQRVKKLEQQKERQKKAREQEKAAAIKKKMMEEEKTIELKKRASQAEKKEKAKVQSQALKKVQIPRKSQEQIKVQRFPKKINEMTARDRQLKKTLQQRIARHQNQPDAYLQIIELLKDKNLQLQTIIFVEQMIRNCRRHKDIILPICKKIYQLYLIFESKDRVIDIFKILQKIQKQSIFGYLYQTYLSIMNGDRQNAKKGIQACKIALFVDEWFSEQEMFKTLLQNQVFLFCSLIGKETMDLSSLEAIFKKMLKNFEDCYTKKKIEIFLVIQELILLKNLTVECSFITPKTFLFLEGVSQQIFRQYSTQLFVKEEIASICMDAKSLRAQLVHDCNIIAFPSTLTQVAVAVENKKLRLKIMVPAIPEEQAKQQYITVQCRGITGHNGRVKCSEGKSLTQIYEQITKQMEQK